MVVNDSKLAQVKKILGTKGIRDTCEAALDQVLAVHARARAVERVLRLERLEREAPLWARDEVRKPPIRSPLV